MQVQTTIICVFANDSMLHSTTTRTSSSIFTLRMHQQCVNINTQPRNIPTWSKTMKTVIHVQSQFLPQVQYRQPAPTTATKCETSIPSASQPRKHHLQARICKQKPFCTHTCPLVNTSSLSPPGSRFQRRSGASLYKSCIYIYIYI